jgi:hypothetical protein
MLLQSILTLSVLVRTFSVLEDLGLDANVILKWMEGCRLGWSGSRRRLTADAFQGQLSADHSGRAVLRHELSSLARTLGSWVRIPLKTWMCVCIFSVFVLSCVQVSALRLADPPSK